MTTSRKRLAIFGQYHAALVHARENGYSPSEWFLADCREKVMGLDPRQFDMAIVGGQLDEGITEALKEWEFRRKVLS